MCASRRTHPAVDELEPERIGPEEDGGVVPAAVLRGTPSFYAERYGEKRERGQYSYLWISINRYTQKMYTYITYVYIQI